VKAWDRGDEPRRDDHAETLAAIEEAGIDLDPTGSRERAAAGEGRDRPGPSDDQDHDAQPHDHPHVQSAADEPPVIGIVGAGAVGTALGVALDRAGWRVHAVATRDDARRERFRSLVPGVRPFTDAPPLVEEVELIILAVPDDAIPRVAGSVHMYGGQAMVHTSGLLGAEALAPAMAAGTQVGSFHPLVAFADVERAVAALHGATVAIEGDEQLLDLLARMADALGATPVRLAPGAKATYHAAAVLAAGGFDALLDAIAELGRLAGLDETGSLAIYGNLIEQTLANARTLGIDRALTGPATRGDRGTVAAHVAALDARTPDVAALYRVLARREIAIAERRGALTPNAASELVSALSSRIATPD
jgi:predicted short-subunit dehydrogenase-like oxidoreductase (DUF2520 family)